jgi:SAM-dependent methyltransferase
VVMSVALDPLASGTPVRPGENPGRSAPGLPAEVIWHDLECGSYRADLPLWHELAAAHDGPILDVGAGTGRVTLDLARDARAVTTLDLAQPGRRVTALDLNPVLLDALRGRAEGLDVETACADACSFELPRRDIGLCLIPMQTIQLLGGAAERAAFLRCARAHLRPGGLLACAIVTELDPFDVADGSTGPSPETARVGGALYVSQATSVRVLSAHIVIERERRIVSSDANESGNDHPVVEPAGELNIIELARVSASELECEGTQAGLRPEPAREIEPTDEHVGSTVVMLRA